MSYASTLRFLRTGYSGMVGGSAAPDYLCGVFCTMRAAYLTYRNAHWMVSGRDAYSLHLLFKRLYNESKDSIDAVAEQIVGTFGPNGIREDTQVMGERAAVFAQQATPVAKALSAAQAVRAGLTQAHDAMHQDGKLTPGWDATLSEAARVNDKHLYLLQQAGMAS